MKTADYNSEMTEKEMLKDLSSNYCLKISEAMDICKRELGERFNEEKFADAALELYVESLPSAGRLTENGVTVVKGEWDD